MSVETVEGIGPTYSARLQENGISTLSELLEHSPEEIARFASSDSARISPERAERWHRQAADHLDQSQKPDSSENQRRTDES